MDNDSFTEFVQQGPVIRLILTMLFFGVLWFASMALVVARANERKRREKEGRSPLPSLPVQIWNWLQGIAAPQTNTSSSSTMPEPSPDDLTSDLPEPDVEDFLRDDFEQPEVVAETIPRPQPDVVVEQTDEEMETVGKEPDRSAQDVYVPGSDELPADAVEIMRVWRDLSDGSLIIQLGDTLFQTVPEMRDQGKARRFIKLVRELARMAKIGAQAAGLPPPDFESGTEVISQQGAWATQKPVAPSRPPAVPTTPPITATTEVQSTEMPTGASTIADQIEELLQYRLTQTPIFQHRSIHVRSNLDGSLRIEVDGRFYEHVDEVVDVDVREFLQNVIREWEARQ